MGRLERSRGSIKFVELEKLIAQRSLANLARGGTVILRLSYGLPV